jgi:hypothetical protein
MEVIIITYLFIRSNFENVERGPEKVKCERYWRMIEVATPHRIGKYNQTVDFGLSQIQRTKEWDVLFLCKRRIR